MQDVEEKIKQEAEQMRNEIVLEDFITCRLLGWTDQFEEDLYWVIMTRRQGIGVALELWSCVGSFTKLKNVLSKQEYSDLERTYNINDMTVKNGYKLARKQGIVIK